MKSYQLLFLGVLVFIACNKDISIGDQTFQSVNTRSGVSIVNYNGEQIPYYSNFTLYLNKAVELDSLVELWEEQFVNTHYTPQLPPVNWDSLITATGFNPQQPLLDFENSINFQNPLRKEFNSQEELWMQDTTEMHPFDKYDVVGSELSLLNSKQRFMVGDTIYQIKDDGVYKIFGNYSTILAQIDNGNNVDSLQFAIFCLPIGNATCSPWKSKSPGWEYTTWDYETNEAIFAKYKVSFHNWCNNPTAASASVRIYRMDNAKTYWEKAYTDMDVFVRSMMYTKRKCGKFEDSKGKPKRKQKAHSISVTVRDFRKPFKQLKTKNANLFGAESATIGIFEFPKYGVYKEVPLGW